MAFKKLRAKCVYCGKKWAVRTDGMLHSHTNPSTKRRCIGSGTRPA